MALRWRIRHKLMMGLGLVVGVIALLLVGTLYGLISFRGTMKAFSSKLAELTAAEKVRSEIKNIKAAAENSGGAPDEFHRLLERIDTARKYLDDYHAALGETVQHGRDPDQGYHEYGLVEALRNDFDDLERAVGNLKGKALAFSGPSKPVSEDGEVKRAIDATMNTSGDLLETIYNAHFRLNKEGRAHYTTSLWTVIAVSVGGVVLLGSLLRFFYRWVFYPIRDLEAGAGRLAQGDFDHLIEVHSGDEMEDLARAFNDMTARLREMYRDLARQVNERSRQLVRSERLVSVGFLAAGVAHEINNPLASIAFCSEALQQRLVGLLPAPAAPRNDDRDVVARYLRTIHEEAFRCKKITSRLLEFSRGGENSRERTNLADIVQSVLELVATLKNSKDRQIIFNPNVRVEAWVNAEEIKSVVLNLVVNALDSMDEGGTLKIILGQRGGMACMEFVDSGCGMSGEVLENIFEPFFTRSRTGKGTGLGLSISHRIISAHGGEIEASSPGSNQGSTFLVRLPLRPPVEPAKEESLGNVAA